MFDTLQYYLLSTHRHDKKISRREFNLFKKENNTDKSLLFVKSYNKLLPYYKELSFTYSAITILCLGSQQVANLMGNTSLVIAFCIMVLFFAVLCVTTSFKASMNLNGPIVYLRDSAATLEELDEDFLDATVIGDEIWMGKTYIYVLSPNGMQICDKNSIRTVTLEPFKGLWGNELKDAAVLTINGCITIKKPVHDLILWSYIRDRLAESIKK